MKADANNSATLATDLAALSDGATRAIPPLWPLSSSVAVNPFLGQADRSLAEVSALMDRVAGMSMTMPYAWYRARMEDGSITDHDLEAALAADGSALFDSLEALKAAASGMDGQANALPTVADLAAEVSGIDWPGLIMDRIGTWAAGYFDTGQALWQVTSGRGAFESWRSFASRDLTPEIAGLTGFAEAVATAPGKAEPALLEACTALDIDKSSAPTYFHALLLSLGGWSQAARQRLWQAELVGESDKVTSDMLTIRLMWEQALFEQYKDVISARWVDVRGQHSAPLTPEPAQVAAAILQVAAERAGQRALATTLSGDGLDQSEGRPSLQAAFCIDVRSEVFRRALESLDPRIQTVGFAGFFGLTPAHRDFASDVVEARLPVLLNPALESTATAPGSQDDDRNARLAARAARAWGRFRLAAVSSFAFVEATGPLYVVKLLRDAIGLPKKARKSPPEPQFATPLPLADRIAAAGTILRAMSMTQNFAPLVLLVGHGANVVNNPHASALHCGACGGYSGDVNARLLAGLLNDTDVRAGLSEEGIVIPSDTVFVGALHDTTTDAVTVFETKQAPGMAKAKAWLEAAATLSKTERALRLPRADDASAIAPRSTDWAETRPEWALAGCSAFIAAPRARTRGKALGGRAFLHDYNWQQDEGFKVLELILTAPVVVASWISLQYYGSVVAPHVFGAGNKLLHNVTGGIGVVEGNGGVLRTGLPWQSVHDGEKFAHDPLRLTICVEAPADAVNEILGRHEQVKALFDNRWLHLLLLDEQGQIAQRYQGDLKWEAFAAQSQPACLP
ncbi:MAG: DUF2309 domain-containing protein [Pseudomonadota bacterium]